MFVLRLRINVGYSISYERQVVTYHVENCQSQILQCGLRRASIAQLAEQWPFKPTVPGSIPGGRTKKRVS